MKITEKQPINLPKSKLQAFSERSFNLELTGFEVLALYKVSRNIGGFGKFRYVFSDKPESILNKLEEIFGLDDASDELDSFLRVSPTDNCISISDNL